MEDSSHLINSYITIPPFASTMPGDRILIFEKDEMLMLFNEKTMEYDYNYMIKNHILDLSSEEDRDFIRTLAGSINYEAIVDSNYRIKLNKKLIDKYNLKEGFIIERQGHHLVINGFKTHNRTK